MKKILSCILAAAMLVGMLTVGAVAETKDLALKFNDIPKGSDAGTVGMANLYDAEIISNDGFTMVMDFIYGRSGPCYHPTDAKMKHTSKFVFMLGFSENNHKYVGYSATDECFFVGTCVNAPVYGEGADGIEYLATSDKLDERGEIIEKGIVLQPGVSYNVAYEFTHSDDPTLATVLNIYVDGEKVLTSDLYNDLDYPTYYAFSGLMMYPTHMTCFVDNFAVYAKGVYDPATGESTAEPGFFSSFDDGVVKEVTETDDEGNETVKTAPVVPGWQIVNDVYSFVETEYDVYAQPNYIPEEGQANIIFQSDLNRKLEGHEDETFSSGKDFNIDITIKNNAGFDNIEMELVNDPYITVKEVKAADGLTAVLGETDANGLSKLTITGSNYTGEALATVTYTMSESATQDHFYRYGARVSTLKISGNLTDAVITGGISKVYNYTVGDPNDDGFFNMADVTLILKIAAKWKLPGVFPLSGDVNIDFSPEGSDGRVNTMDATYYMRYLAGWKGFSMGGHTNW